MQTVAFLNRKGGVGKTSTCLHLSYALAKLGRRVLLVDLDSQANLTEGILGLEEAESLTPRQTVAGLFDESAPAEAAALVRPTPFAGIAILPGHEATEDHYRQPREAGDLQYALRDALDELSPSFDLALCDCPPNILLTSWAALAAADGVVVPLLSEEFAAGGLAKIQRPIARARQLVNPRLALLGYLLTMYNKSLMVHVAYEADLRQVYPADVFDAVVPLAKDFKEAVGYRKPIGAHRPRSAGARAIDRLALELIHRLDARAARDGRAA